MKERQYYEIFYNKLWDFGCGLHYFEHKNILFGFSCGDNENSMDSSPSLEADGRSVGQEMFRLL
jgi:hypothetical protein